MTERKNWTTAVQQFEAGWTLGQIAEAHGVTRQRISQVLRRDGLDPQAARNKRGRGRRAERVERVARLSRQGLLTREIAARLGISDRTVLQAMRLAGEDATRAWFRIRRERDEAKWRRWLAYYQRGRTLQETADHFGVSITIVNVRLLELGYEPHHGRTA